MTAHQWIFHYHECMRAKKERAKKEKSIINILETFAMYSHPSVDIGKIQAKMQERHINETIADVKDDLEEQANALLNSVPRAITVAEDKKKRVPILKTMKLPTKRKKKNEIGES